MPTYEYACKACGHRLEAVQKFTDDALTTCPDCGGELRKVFGAPGIVLKGSGFYKTDTRAQDKKRSGSDKSGGSNGSDPAPGDSKGDTKGDTKGDIAAKSESASTADSPKSAPSSEKSNKESKPAAAAAT